MKVILPKYPDSYDLVENDDSDLQTEGFYNAKKVFVLTMNDTDNNKPLQESTVYKIIKNFKHVISLHIQLPDISKGESLIHMYYLHGYVIIQYCDKCEIMNIFISQFLQKRWKN